MPNLRSKTWTTTTPATVNDAQYWEDHLISDSDAAKIATSVQTVNNTAPDASGNVDVSVGHTIQNASGTDMPYQSTLQFTGADVSNDSVNGKTIVDCHGEKGDAATIAVGTVTTLPAGSDATVTNAGTPSAAVFNFGIPQGQDGSGAVDSVNGKTGIVVLTATDVSALPDSTTIPTSLSELSDDTTHRLVTDAEKTAWDAKVSESLLKDTVGWVGKNKLAIEFSKLKAQNAVGTWSGNVYTNGGIAYTCVVDANGYVTSISASGTAGSGANIGYNLGYSLPNGNYKFNGAPDGGGSISSYKWFMGLYKTDLSSGNALAYDFEGDVDVNLNLSTPLPNLLIKIEITNGQTVSDKVFYPMLRDASITDSTFESYHKSVEDWYWENNPNAGAKNLLPIELTSQTESYLAITVDANGIKGAIKLNTTQAVSANVGKVLGNVDLVAGKQYTLSIGNAFNKSSNANIGLVGYNGSSWVALCVVEGTSTSETFTAPSSGYTQYRVQLYVASGVTFDNFTIYPMLRLASDPDSTYQPYAMTNRELTEKALISKGTFSSVDLNNFKESGLYTLNGSITNTPNSVNYGVLEVNNYDAQNAVQKLYPTYSGENIYIRTYRSGTWGSWYSFTGTVVS